MFVFKCFLIFREIWNWAPRRQGSEEDGGVLQQVSFFLFYIFFKPKFNHCLPLSVNHYYLTNSCCRDLIDLFSSIDLDVYYLALKVRGLSARTPCQGWGWGYTSVDQQVEILQMRKYHRYKYHKH